MIYSREEVAHVHRLISYQGHMAYKKDPTLAPRVLAHEIGHLADWLPDKDMKRGNILGRIGTLKEYVKTTMESLPEMPEDSIAPDERKKMRSQAEKQAGSKPFEKGPDLDEWKKSVSENYKKLVSDRVDERSLITRDMVAKELKAMTQMWNPFTEGADENYTKYRYSSKELYADAISVMLTEPALLRKVAPTFYTAWQNFLVRKPDVRACTMKFRIAYPVRAR